MAAVAPEAGFCEVRHMGHTHAVIGIAGVLVTTLGLATALAASARHFWLGDLAVPFRAQYLALALTAAALLAIAHRPGWALAALCIAAVNAGSLVASLNALARHTSSPAAPGAATLRVASINVYYRSKAFRRVIDFLQEQQPDVVMLVEVTAQWRQALLELERLYPHSYATSGTRGRGVLLLSRWPLANVGVLPIQEDSEPAIRATLQVHSRSMEVFAVHARWPAGPGHTRERNRQLRRIAALVQEARHSVLVIGDLNVSPLSPHFLALLIEGRLRTASQRFVRQPTWPSFLPPMGIQIDHALLSRDLGAVRFERGRGVGSDHRPILVEVVLP